jgi:hypothetical protein
VSKLAYTLAAAAALAAAAVLAGPPAHTARTARTADVAPAQPHTLWSAPAVLSACPAGPTARVVFPSDSPEHATGPGAVVWSASSACPGGEGARVATIGADDVPGTGATPRTAAGRSIAPRGPLVAGGAPHGQIAIAGSSPAAPADGLLIQGAAGGPFAALQPIAGSAEPLALATAYLGDLALAAPPAGGHINGLNVHVERFYSHDFVRNVTARAGGGGPVQALTLAMDYRSEALVVWAQGGAIYARVVPNKGAPHPIQRLAPVGANPRIAAVLSDDERAIVAWSDQHGTQTSVYVDRSATGVYFGSPQLLERFQDPNDLSSPASSPSLVRLSSESVVLAWAGSAAGHWVVRSAPVDLNGVQAVDTIAAPGADALLADLAAGPVGDALVLWTEPLPSAAGPPDMQRQAIFAARGFGVYPGRIAFDEPEQVAPPAPVSDATVALDPDSDRAVAVWQGEAATIEYSIRESGSGS